MSRSDSSSSPAPVPQPPKRLFILFGVLSVWTFLGPLTVMLVGRGGKRPTWPPDRPEEWWTFGVVVAGYLVLLLTTLNEAGKHLRRGSGSTRRSTETPNPPEVPS